MYKAERINFWGKTERGIISAIVSPTMKPSPNYSQWSSSLNTIKVSVQSLDWTWTLLWPCTEKLLLLESFDKNKTHIILFYFGVLDREEIRWWLAGLFSLRFFRAWSNIRITVHKNIKLPWFCENQRLETRWGFSERTLIIDNKNTWIFLSDYKKVILIFSWDTHLLLQTLRDDLYGTDFLRHLSLLI